MKILIIGDIFGNKGIEAVENSLPKVVRDEGVDIVIANAENTTNGKSLNWEDYNKLSTLGIKYFTMGNHTWAHPEAYEILSKQPNIVRPANVVGQWANYGKGFLTFNYKNLDFKLINLIGRSVYRFDKSDNPHITLDRILAGEEQKYINIVDYHTEFTAEKIALGLDFDGKVSVVVGTHTHVPTADSRILSKGTAFITDIGMCGSREGVIGARADLIIRKERYGEPLKVEVCQGKWQFNAFLVEIDEQTKQVTNCKLVQNYEK